MSGLYFKDANGEYQPIGVDYLDIRPNSIIFLQFKPEEGHYRPTHQDLEGLLSVVEDLLGDDYRAKGIEVVIMGHEINIEVLNRDKDLKNKEILIDISKIEGKHNQDYIKSLMGDALKGFHHEFVRLPIKGKEGNA